MITSLIVAVAENNVIGKDNDLIWRLPKDLKYFKEKTLGHHIITGRKNYESIPEKYRPLPDRTNIVLTRQEAYAPKDCITLHSLQDALNYAKKNNETEVFIIGGGQIYKEAIDNDLADRLYVTHVHQSFEGDTFFPTIDESKWKVVSKEKTLPDEKNSYPFTFVVYEKIQ